jgi:hypothetical protein
MQDLDRYKKKIKPKVETRMDARKIVRSNSCLREVPNFVKLNSCLMTGNFINNSILSATRLHDTA